MSIVPNKIVWEIMEKKIKKGLINLTSNRRFLLVSFLSIYLENEIKK